MIKINNLYLSANRLFEISCYIFIIGLFFSRAILSIAIALLFIFGVLSFFFKSKQNLEWDIKFWLFPLIFIFYLLSLFNTSDVENWSAIMLKNSFLFCIPLSFKLSTAVSSKKAIFIFYILLSFVCVIGTTFKFLLDFEIFSTLVLNSKNIISINGQNHTEFGVLSVVAFLMLGNFILKEKRVLQKWLLISITFLFLLCLHIIALRFALVAIYIILILYSIYVLIREKKFILGASILATLVLSSLLLYNSLESFKNRVINTREDIENIIANGNPNFRSIHQRWAAAKCAVEVTKKNIWLGVSPADLSSEMQQQYNINSYLLIPENRVFIHNQILFYLASFGIIFAALFIIAFSYVLYKETKFSYFPVLIIIPFFLHMQIDNTLERQIMGSAMLFFFFLTGNQNDKQYL